MTIGAWLYPVVLVACLALTLVLVPVALRVALRRDLVDHPGGYKNQASPVPYLGGAAMVLAFALVVAAAALLLPADSGQGEIAVLLGVAVGLSLLGLADDLWGLRPSLRLVVETGAGVAVWAAGTGVQLFPQETLNLVLTVAWVVGVTNAFNLLDNMDGLSAGVAAISAGSFFLIAAVNGQYLVGTLAVAVVGCAAGFLRHNRHPARIYMGDAGSLFLGFMLAVIGLKLRFDGPTSVTFFVPVLVLGVALFDTALVTVTRLLHRRGVFTGGRDHTSHRLVFVGVSVRATVVAIYGVTFGLGWLALVMSRLDTGTAWLLMGFVVTAGLVAGVLLSLIPVYESSRRRHLMIQEVVRHEPEPDAATTPGVRAGTG